MARIEDRMTPNAEYADKLQERMQRSKELRMQEEAKQDRIQAEYRNEQRVEQERRQEAIRTETEKAASKETGKGVNADLMA